MSINTSIKLHKKNNLQESLFYTAKPYKKVNTWQKYPTGKKKLILLQNFFFNHTLSIFLWDYVYREQKYQAHSKTCHLVVINQLSELNSTNFYRALIMCQTPSRAEKINKTKAPCLYVPGNFIQRVKSLHKLEHSNCFPPSWRGVGEVEECKGTKKGENFYLIKMVLNFCQDA